jgi:hypothetical protein
VVFSKIDEILELYKYAALFNIGFGLCGGFVAAGFFT